jgi:hypothetical protein
MIGRRPPSTAAATPSPRDIISGRRRASPSSRPAATPVAADDRATRWSRQREDCPRELQKLIRNRVIVVTWVTVNTASTLLARK